MSSITYTAVRSLVAGHSAGTVYSFDQAMLDTGLTPVREIVRTVAEALDGVHREILRQYGRTRFDCKTAPMDAAGLAQMREFLDSCEEYAFTFDPYGTVATPAAPILATLGSEGYTVATTLRLSGGGQADLYQLEFQVIPAQ